MLRSALIRKLQALHAACIVGLRFANYVMRVKAPHYPHRHRPDGTRPTCRPWRDDSQGARKRAESVRPRGPNPTHGAPAVETAVAARCASDEAPFGRARSVARDNRGDAERRVVWQTSGSATSKM